MPAIITKEQATRTGDVWWILRHWDDVLSDMSVFHRLSPAEVVELDPPTLFGRALRLIHYAGVVQAVALKAYRAEAVPVESSVPTDPSPEQVRAMRDAARKRRFDPAKYGEHKYVGLDEFMGVASRG